MDFEKRLQERRKAFDNEQAEREKQAEAARLKKQDAVASAISLLKEFALPTLLSARASLRKNDLDLKIQDDFSEDMPVNARAIASATCCSFARKSDGYRMESRPLVIEVEGEKFKIGFGREYNRHTIQELISTTDPQNSDEVIKGAILTLTDEILAKVKDHPIPWN
ncbi:hypothetical protein BMI91_16965 [Thioclava sediminum]|uniref:Uncharacterized protein n=1 Tax=Thioclava sediminum TaxID=1915319 RepID=A0ABX3MYA6_9RHOB|nr:hypothetical protein [Thioclava sediminum]OOY23134.1 hypothetical protein BMI91_16965 [Thioclava sediminum]